MGFERSPFSSKGLSALLKADLLGSVSPNLLLKVQRHRLEKKRAILLPHFLHNSLITNHLDLIFKPWFNSTQPGTCLNSSNDILLEGSLNATLQLFSGNVRQGLKSLSERKNPGLSCDELSLRKEKISLMQARGIATVFHGEHIYVSVNKIQSNILLKPSWEVQQKNIISFGGSSQDDKASACQEQSTSG